MGVSAAGSRCAATPHPLIGCSAISLSCSQNHIEDLGYMTKINYMYVSYLQPKFTKVSTLVTNTLRALLTYLILQDAIIKRHNYYYLHTDITSPTSINMHQIY